MPPSRLNIATVPSCGTFTNMLPHRNAMLQTQDMTPHPITPYRHIDVEHYTGNHNYPFWYHCSDPMKKSSLNLPHTKQTFYSNVIEMVFSENLSRKCTVCPESQTQVHWLANPRCYPFSCSCFSQNETFMWHGIAVHYNIIILLKSLLINSMSAPITV